MRQSFTLAFKLKVIKEIELSSINSVSKKYKINRRTIQNLIKNKSSIEESLYRGTRHRLLPFEGQKGS